MAQSTLDGLVTPGIADILADAKTHGNTGVNDHTMVINMGPQHPSTHGVLRLVLEIDGESVVGLAPDIGYLHTGIEKTCEAKFYQQVVPLTDRIDYLCPMTNNWAYAMAVEKLLGLEIPERAEYLRVLLNELQRIQSHLVWLGTHAMDIGALTVFLYCFREREALLRIFEGISGQRMMTSYIRVGGLSMEPPLDFYKQVQDFLNDFPSKIEEYEGLLQTNPIFMGRLKGVGYLSAEDAIALGVTGPTQRASGVDWDMRRDMPYSVYSKFQFNVPTSTVGDVWARYVVRMQEFRESGEDLPAGAGWAAGRPDHGRCAEDSAARPRADEDADGKPDPSLQDCDRGVRRAGGRGVYDDRGSAGLDGVLRGFSDGTSKPYRVHMRNPGFATLQALETMCKGRLLADVVAVIGSIDIVLGEIDR